MGLLSKVINLFSKGEPKPLPELELSLSHTEVISSEANRRAAAIAVALHHHSLENDDTRARVAAIAAALHHHELENSAHNKGLVGIASLVAAIHHHNKKTK